MTAFYVYKDGTRQFINAELWRTVFEADGWSKDAPQEEVEPVLDFAPYDNAQLLHIAAVTNVVVDTNADRATLEEALRLMWSAGGKPPDWLQSALAAAAPISTDEYAEGLPKAHSDPEIVKTPEEFAGEVADALSDVPVEEVSE